MIYKRYRANPRLTPRVGLEPTTTRLTAECSTIELSRNISYYFEAVPSKPNTKTFPYDPDLYRLIRLFLPTFTIPLRISLRPISSIQLSTLLHLHPCPIYLVVFKGSYPLLRGISHLEGGFTLRCLQRLSLPDLATLPWRWSPTGTPAVRPSRSSRTKDSSSQISCAHAG